MNICTFWKKTFTKLIKFRALKIAKTAILELLHSPNWFHVKSKWLKNPETSTPSCNSHLTHNFLIDFMLETISPFHEKRFLVLNFFQKVKHKISNVPPHNYINSILDQFSYEILVGLEVACSLRVREVPGSNLGGRN